ncbi:flippase [Spirosoma endophyticum]|uniref:Polysaccharide transporter, PST family n=1 Tax=Spirosoma endophyticum TaxID=662367 RepID=A0A1I2FTW6_9BACT|nr:flippase [Spirosoma endophyticum]SFF07966.1 polysaccharide transporter, PST family [Spirosoma endophyticum]
MNSNNSKNQLTKNVFSLTIVQVATYILPLISVPVVSRIIGPAKYGIINFSAAYISYFTLLISYSFDFTATRKIAREPNNECNRNLVFSEVFYTQCLLFVFSLITFTILLFNVSELKENITVVIFSFSICVATLFTQNWLFQAMQDLSKVALFNLISRLIFTLLILLIVRKNADYIWQPLLLGVVQTTIAIWSFIWAFKKYKLRFIKVSIIRCFQLLWEERIIFLSLIFVNFYSSTNTVILGLYQDAEQVGYYTAAQRLIIIAQSVLAMPLAQAFYPFIGKAFGESREQGLKVAQKLISFIVIYVGLASIMMCVLGPFVIRAFYGQKFEAAIPIFQILTIIPLLFSLNNVLGIQIMLNLGMDKYFLKVTAAAGVLSIFLNILTVKHLGYIGSTINWLIIEFFLFGNMYIILKQQNLNPINSKYFKFSLIIEYIKPLKEKLFKL